MPSAPYSRAPLKTYLATFSWTKEEKGRSIKTCRLSAVAVARSIEDAVADLYDALERDAKLKTGNAVDAGIEIFLDDLAEISHERPLATLVCCSSFESEVTPPMLHGTLGGNKVAHYEGDHEPAEPDPTTQLPSFTPRPFAVIAADRSMFRPSG